MRARLKPARPSGGVPGSPLASHDHTHHRNCTVARPRRLGEVAWLDRPFSAGDLLMVAVLRRLDGKGLLEKHPNLCAHVVRGKARPAYRRVFGRAMGGFRCRCFCWLTGSPWPFVI